MADRSYLAGLIPPPTPGATVNSNLNLFDLPPEGFRSYLNELAAQGVNTDELMRQYRRANSPFSGLFDWAINSERDIANEGRTTAGAGLFSKEAGTTGMDALASTRIEPANFIAGLLSGGAQAVDAAGATLKGLVPAADMPMEALGTAGMAMTGGAAVPKPRGALGANALRQVDEYGGSHRAPRRSGDYGASLDDPREMFGGDDIYTSNAARYFGHGDPAMDRESIRAINTARSNPDAEVTVYRAVPKDLEGAQINAGDWVTPSRRYANLHGEGPLGGDYQIIEQKVRAGDLFTDGDIHEWGYDPLTTSANREAPKIDVLGSGYGQTDMRLTLPNVEGRIDYSVFEGRPKINMVEVPESARRQGNATKLLQALQEQFPDTEIDWGSLTTDGSSLFKSTNFSEIPSAYAGDFARLDAAKSRLAAMQSDFAGMQARNQSPPAGFFDEWNDLQDEIYNLSSELEFKSPVERIISANRDATAGAIALPAARTEAEAMARQILEMRAAGRAGEVTDAMMAQADPQYMFNNTPLPMDEASRMARAGEMGFDTPAYHGTTGDFQSARGDFYTTPNTEYANVYAGSMYDEGGRVLPLMQREGDILDTRKPIGEKVFNEDFYMQYGNASPLTSKGVPDWVEGPDFGEMFTDKGLPYRGVFLDEGKVPLGDGTLLDRGISTLHFDPTNIRSRFARFDPEFSHLANLNAANASPLAGILAMPNEEERNRQLGLLFGGYR